jgi:hypothetical protein
LIKTKAKRIYQRLRRRAQPQDLATLLLLGKQMSWNVASFPPNADFREVGFTVFSQWDEDGIIQYLINKVPIPNRTFIEFGVENYEESNTRFLLINNHWKGMVLDACEPDIQYVQTDPIHWQFDLQAKCAWITKDNIDALLQDSGFASDAGLLSIDINGNEYWIWEAIQSLRPRIVIVEYNSLFGLSPISVPYAPAFDRTAAHYSNLYYGCSLGALQHLAHEKGYILLGSNIWGHNAFFLRSDIAGEFQPVPLERAYVRSRFRESRSPSGQLTYVRENDRVKLIEHLPVVNVITGAAASLRDSLT